MLNRFTAKIALFFILAITSETTFASIFSVIPSDKSKEYLGIIFGGSVGPLSLGGHVNFTIFSAMMEKFNLIMLIFGVIFLSYITISSTINTAREGEALGKKFSIFVPARAFIGIFMMVPGYSSGYSIIQISVMWLVLHGIGVANSAWNVILQQLSAGINISSNIRYENEAGKITPLDLSNLTKDVMKASACKNVINQEMPELSTIPGLFQRQGPIKIYVVAHPVEGNIGYDTKIRQTAEVKIGLRGADAPYDHICGQFLVDAELNKNVKDTIFTEANLHNRLAIKLRALVAMFEAVDPATTLLSKGNFDINHIDQGYVTAAGEAYINQLSALTREKSLDKTNLTKDQQTLKSYGWIMAGSYYYTITKESQNKVVLDSELTAEKKNSIGRDAMPNEVYSLLSNEQPFEQHKKLDQAIQKVLDFWEKDKPKPEDVKSAHGVLANNTSTSVDPRVNKFIEKTVDQIKQPFSDYLKSVDAGDPLSALGEFGRALTSRAEGQLFNVNQADLQEYLNLPEGKFFEGIWFLIVIIGATLGIYIPLVPYLVFLISAFGWFMAVIEAVFLCPMITVALCYPSDEILSKLTNGLHIIINIMLRPILMIFGFVAGITLMRAGFSFLNFGFIPALNAGTTPTIFSILSVLVVYAFIVMSIVNKSFSLIHLLPAQVMRYIGGQAEHSDTQETVREVKTGFDSTVGRDQALMNRAAGGNNNRGNNAGGNIPQPPIN